MRLFTVLFVVVVVVSSPACTRPDSPSVEPSVDNDACRTSAGEGPTPTGSTELVLAAVARAQANDLDCGPPEDRTRICRALFLVSTLDPVLYLEQDSLRQATSNALLWGLDDAEEVAPPDLSGALAQLRDTIQTIKTSSDESVLSTAIGLRAQPAITEPIDRHWRANCA